MCDLDMQRTITISTIIKEGHVRIIHAKFGKNPGSSLGDVLWSNVDDGRRATDDARRTSNDQNSSPWANVLNIYHQG